MRRLGMLGAMLALPGARLSVIPARPLDDFDGGTSTTAAPVVLTPVEPPKPRGNYPGSVRRRMAREAAKVCSTCEGGGWECYGTGHHDPHFRVCPECGNPEGHPCP